MGRLLPPAPATCWRQTDTCTTRCLRSSTASEDDADHESRQPGRLHAFSGLNCRAPLAFVLHRRHAKEFRAMRRLLTIAAVALTLGLALASTASAQQGFSVYLGAFTPQGIDSRGSDDVLYQNSTFLSTLNSPRGIDMNEFNGFTFGGEYLIGFGPHFEAGLGVGFYQKTAPAVYTDLVNATGQEIFQDIKLRVYPFSATVKF